MMLSSFPAENQRLLEPEEIHLRRDEVHVWIVTLSEVPGDFAHSLNKQEWERAARFYATRDRNRFVAARSSLREILARYLEAESGSVRFTSGPHGKPALQDPHCGICFNLSHSGDLMVLAVVQGREVGVDVERVRDNVEIDMLIEQYFTLEDAKGIQSLPRSRKMAEFFGLWTRTEACLKASGVGITDGLRITDRSRWSVHSFLPAPGYTAALAVEGGEDFNLSCLSWPR
ncbi:MAG: 4'-phosphopantetheinyl transferase superfamily protein [Verrucomicrobiaceae bacterium]|nr:MAG: 4'-phosphopantetheinyl transferase superfamily protein [Verrucomicrobiaceae bacterium]